ncbi:MAG: hypothetical protein KF760_23675 [Candidatus Eremiobacteraeota bacterium]|nr:hypothetical protein [Candidatus Eremiobacteraeota bacterium]MCW5866225.1 hypothetical protein [Candidatus Eremiobacteraeota bacterium]
MWEFLLTAALAANPLDSVLDRLDSGAAEVSLQVRLIPSSLDPDVLWMPYDSLAKSHDGGHWIPPLRQGIAEKALPEWPAQEGTTRFAWSDELERRYYLPVARRFATQQLPFRISLQVEASRNAEQSCSLQVEVSTTVVSDASAISTATTRVRTRRAEGQLLPGQSLVISNLYPYEEVLPILGEMPVLGPLFLPSTTGPMVVLTPV